MWPFRRRKKAPPSGNGNGAAAAKAVAESTAKKRAAEQMTPIYERLAPLQDLSPEEFAERVIRAFGRRA
jgi:hypothetical protein